MPGVMDFYFDFISPFSYLAHTQLPDIAARHGRDIVYHPVDLKALKLDGGNTGPTTRDMPLKYRYSGTDMQRWAGRYGVKITRPTGHAKGSDRLNKGAFLAEDRGVTRDYVTAAWQRVWCDGGDMSDEALIGDVAVELGWDRDEFLAFIDSTDTETRYRASTQAAHDRGVFGVPTMMVGDEMWWGNDRLDFMEEFLAG
ncbi:MAG: 2-hydroxychromene-2-carboxylate isomerase [Rhodospirillales bacterium]|nr:2-hydroxychromene-2-carboxylate isomerase [Rhodospirillales bacterium]